jgi:hypothetical protein
MDPYHSWKLADCDGPNGLNRLRVSVDRGCLQGGVLSPLLWSLVVDRLLECFSGECLYTQGYTDDLALLTTGKFPSTVPELMLRALNIVQRWCRAICQS